MQLAHHIRFAIARRCVFELALLAAAAFLTSCSHGGEGGNGGMKLAELRAQLIEASFPQEGVMRMIQRVEPVQDEVPVATTEQRVWRSASTGEARIETGIAEPEIFADGAWYRRGANGKLQSLPYERLDDNLALLGSVSILFQVAAEGAPIEIDQVDGVPAMRIDVPLPGPVGTSRVARVFIDEETSLPIRIVQENYILLYEHEIIARDSLAADFFSPESLESTSDTGE
jgi:hypothetical protein